MSAQVFAGLQKRHEAVWLHHGDSGPPQAGAPTASEASAPSDIPLATDEGWQNLMRASCLVSVSALLRPQTAEPPKLAMLGLARHAERPSRSLGAAQAGGPRGRQVVVAVDPHHRSTDVRSVDMTQANSLDAIQREPMHATRFVSVMVLTVAGGVMAIALVIAGTFSTSSPEHTTAAPKANTGVAPTTTSPQSSTTTSTPTADTSWNSAYCPSDALSSSDAQTIRSDFGRFSCILMTSGDASIWILVGRGSLPENALSTATGTTIISAATTADIGSAVAVYSCSGSSCSGPSVTIPLSAFTVYYPPNPSGFLDWDKIPATPPSLTLDDNGVTCRFIFDPLNGDWYDFNSIWPGCLTPDSNDAPLSAPAPEPLTTAVASGPPAATMACEPLNGVG